MIEYQVEAFADVRLELPPLLREHDRKVGQDRHAVPFDFDYDLYQTLDDGGFLHTPTVRQDRKLIGYGFIMTTRHPHSRRVLTAQWDAYYVRPTGNPMTLLGRYRGLIRMGEQELRRLGVRKVYGGVSLASDFGRLWESLGYAPVERLYSRVLE